MKDLKIVVLAALTAAASSPLFAAPRLCANGLPPHLTGDLFAPVECSTAAKTAPFLPAVAVRPAAGAKTDLRDVEGRWEGSLVHGLGRYSLLLTVKTGWTGKTEAVLEMQELQFRERLTDRLSLRPAKEKGSYEIELTTSKLPEGSLSGRAAVGEAALPEASTAAVKAASADRQVDLSFSNGASHRLYFSLNGKDELRVRAFSGIPGAPLQKFETTLARTKREAL